MLLSFGELVPARLLRRYKRFLSDARLRDGTEVTAHCPNPGRMTSILPQAEEILLTDLGPPSGKPVRKLRYRWELAKVGGSWVTVNTQLANKVAAQLLKPAGHLHRTLGLSVRGTLESEVTIRKGFRVDFQYTDAAGGEVLIEVKQVTLRVGDRQGVACAAFPDAVTARGRRHLEHLAELRREGKRRTVLVYLVGRDDVAAVRPAGEVDPAYAEAFARALDNGVEAYAVGLKASPRGITLAGSLPVYTH